MVLRRLAPCILFALCACASPKPSPIDDVPSASISSAKPIETPPAVSIAPSASVAVIPASAPAPTVDEYPDPPPPNPSITLAIGGKFAARGEAGMVTSVESNATRIGAEILRRGGNAVDAAVAMAYALAVTHPSAGNIGGGGLLLVRLANGESHLVDFRETAPALGATTEKVMAMLDHDGGIGIRSTGVPGTVAGLSLALDKFGSMKLADLIAPAKKLAEKGFKLGPRQALTVSWNWKTLKHDPGASAIWGRNKKPLGEGEIVKQKDLATTLGLIAEQGSKAFYEGSIAQAIDAAMQKGGGYVLAKDLADYRAKLRKPLRFNYRGFTVETAPPPSMGGIAFALIMRTLERLRAYEQPPNSANAIHLFVEASRRAYADRRLVAADPDFAPADLETTLAKFLTGAHVATRKPAIDLNKATPSADISVATAETKESPETTHFSVVDIHGNAVSCTYTLSAGFGSKVVIPKTGILLGNALGGFSKDGPNAVAPGKRMATSMSPTIVTQNGRLVLVLGSPGGDTIPNTVAQVFRNIVDWGMTIDEAVNTPRVHHQFLPDKLRVEKQRPLPKNILAELTKRGHTVDTNGLAQGDANDILIDPATGIAYGFADPREGGASEGIKKSEIGK
jgi:gamma-glutamyltranspeptidase / glutathione hydrolase